MEWESENELMDGRNVLWINKYYSFIYLYVDLRKHDVCFLIGIKAQMGLNEKYDPSKNFAEQVRQRDTISCNVDYVQYY